MNFPFFIAKRYLISKKSTNLINLISGISATGIMFGTMALVIVLSVFNGLESLILSYYNSFNPDLEITLKKGKLFNDTQPDFEQIKNLEEIAGWVEIIEDNALLKYDNKESIVKIKGVSQNYALYSGIDTMLIDGEFSFGDEYTDYAVLGYGIARTLGIGLHFIEPLSIYVVKRTDSKNLRPESAIKKKSLMPGGIFSVQQDIDNQYCLVSLSFARSLFDAKNELSAVELFLKPDTDLFRTQKKISDILGDEFVIKNNFEKQEMIYKTIHSEKLIAYIILALILVVASFNIIGSLTMLIIDKKKDIFTLQSMGANFSVIRKIFLFEGWLISLVGSFSGIFIGWLVCLTQQKFEVLKLQSGNNIEMPPYPIEMHFFDFVLVGLTVVIIGYFAAWYPVRFITKKYINEL